jgi:hypothetical protein
LKFLKDVPWPPKCHVCLPGRPVDSWLGVAIHDDRWCIRYG